MHYLITRKFKRQNHTIPKGYTLRRNGVLYYKVYNREGKLTHTAVTITRDVINDLLEAGIIVQP